ncbi:Vesicle-associated protein 2-2-like protein [Drosera capensis]
MSSQLLEIQPRDLRFIFELQKQTSCTVKLTNKTEKHVAFKVKTTSPKKYCVKPNVGIVLPRATFEFIVAMQAQQVAPPDMVCKDKFLVQSAIVSLETEDVDITPDMFLKGEGRSVEEKKLRVILVAPSHSPELAPVNGSLQQIPTSDDLIAGDEPSSHEETVIPSHMEHLPKSKTMTDENLMPVGDSQSGQTSDTGLVPIKEVEPGMTEELESKLLEDGVLLAAGNGDVKSREIESKSLTDAEQLQLYKVLDEMKSRVHDLESKLRKAEVAMAKLADERRSTVQDTEILQKELVLLKERRVERKVKTEKHQSKAAADHKSRRSRTRRRPRPGRGRDHGRGAGHRSSGGGGSMTHFTCSYLEAVGNGLFLRVLLLKILSYLCLALDHAAAATDIAASCDTTTIAAATATTTTTSGALFSSAAVISHSACYGTIIATSALSASYSTTSAPTVCPAAAATCGALLSPLVLPPSSPPPSVSSPPLPSPPTPIPSPPPIVLSPPPPLLLPSPPSLPPPPLVLPSPSTVLPCF